MICLSNLIAGPLKCDYIIVLKNAIPHGALGEFVQRRRMKLRQPANCLAKLKVLFIVGTALTAELRNPSQTKLLRCKVFSNR